MNPTPATSTRPRRPTDLFASMVGILLALAVLDHLVAWVARDRLTYRGKEDNVLLFRRETIRQAREPVDVLFLGDSTVASGIDTDLFEEVTGLTALNLGLVGNWTTYGDRILFEDYLSRHPPPRWILVSHSSTVWSRTVPEHLVLYSRPRGTMWLDYLTSRLTDTSSVRAVVHKPVTLLASLLRGSLYQASFVYRERNALVDALTTEGGATAATLGPAELRPDTGGLSAQIEAIETGSFDQVPSASTRFWFRRLVERAQEEGVDVLVYHAPIHEAFEEREATRRYLQVHETQLADLVGATPGARLITDGCGRFPPEHGHGDMDHVAEAGRRNLTRRLGKRLQAVSGPPDPG